MGDDYSQHASSGGKTGGVAKTGSGPAAAGGSAAADRGGAAATDKSTAATKMTLGERVKRSPWWSKLFGVLGILGVAAATYLLIVGTTDIAVAGYILAVIGIVLAAVPILTA
jgi:hypothetical protein